MSRIDEPQDQLDFVHRDANDLKLISIVFRSALPVMALLSGSHVTGLAGFSALVLTLFNEARAGERIKAMYEGLREAFVRNEGELDGLEGKLASDLSDEAVAVLIAAVIRTTRVDKARRFGTVFGATLAADNPNWEEAAVFIQQLEQLNDSDIQALTFLWSAQRTAGRRTDGSSGFEMSTSPHHYMKTWANVVQQTSAHGISPDDWSARCARLGGFGLALPAQVSPVKEPERQVFRLTGAASRLLDLLGLLKSNVQEG